MMNDIKAFNTLANDRGQMMTRLAEQQAARSTTSALTPAMREIVDRLSLLGQHDRYLDQLDAAAPPCRATCLKTGLVSTAVAGLGIAGMHAAGGWLSTAATIAAGLGGLVAVVCAVQARDTFRVQRWAGQERAAHGAERAELERRRETLATTERSAAEARVRESAEKSGAVAMTVVTQTERDGAVALAARELAEREKAIASARALLASDRQQLFADAPQKMNETWTRIGPECSSTVMTAVGTGALVSAGAAGLLFGTEAAALTIGSLMVGGIFAARLILKKWVPAVVERTMRAELTAQMKADEAMLDPLRAALEAARTEAGGRYVKIADEAQANGATPQPSVRIDAGEVTVGGIKLKRNSAT